MENSLADSARSSIVDDRIASLATLAELVRSRVPPNRFYRSLVDTCLESTEAIAACLWVKNVGQWRPAVEGDVSILNWFVDDRDAERDHHRELVNACRNQSVHRFDSDTTDGAFLAIHIGTQASEQVVLEIVTTPEAVDADATFLQAAGEIAVEHFLRQPSSDTASVNRDERAESRQFENFLLALHSEPTLHNTVFTIANDGRAIANCDRLSVAVKSGRRFTIQAISGQTEVNPRANAVSGLAAVANRVGQIRTPQAYGGSEEADSEFRSLVSDYLKESAATQLLTEPLISTNGECVGVLLAEAFSDSSADKDALKTISRHSAIAVQNVLNQANRRQSFARGFTRRRAAFALAAFAFVAALCLIPAELAIETTGEIQPAERRNIFANRDAVVQNVLVEDGAVVEVGDPLVELSNTNLEYELSRISGDILTTTERRAALESAVVLESNNANGGAAESAELKLHLQSLYEQQEILKQAKQRLTLRSPVSGQLMTWNPRELLAARPVRRGQVLLTVANPDGDWILDLTVPDEDFAHISAAKRESDEPLKVSFRTSTEPGRAYDGVLTDIATTTETDDVLGPVVRITVRIDNNQIKDLRPGIGVIAHVHCGQRSLGYVWLRGLIDSTRGWVAMW
ncbi:MAG: efflux RND transporter periplasmic adaptor subunit [Planctomycetaceae bacterium]